jgi:serine/threonine protein kinase
VKAGERLETATNSYQVLSVVGQGGSGVVYKATDGSAEYAAKCLHPDLATVGRLKRFANELRFCERNSHANIIRVLDHGTTISGGKKTPFYIMPLYSRTLRGLMNGGMRHDQILPLFSNVLNGVEAAHLLRVWHRDLKPENILCDAECASVVVADFGIAHFEEDEIYTAVETKNGDRLANFQYAAPEQRVRAGQVDLRADIFALGLILNEMFTGQVLQGSGHRTIASVAPDFAYLDDIISAMVRQSPAERPGAIDEIKNELRRKGDEFISAQKISKLTQTVVPQAELDDPLVANAVRLASVDYNGEYLFFELDPPVNPTWIQCFKSIGSYQSVLGKGPPYFGWDHGRAVIQANEQEAPLVAEHFKTYVRHANEAYAELLRANKRAEEERQRSEIRRQLEIEQKRQRVLQKIKL